MIFIFIFIFNITLQYKYIFIFHCSLSVIKISFFLFVFGPLGRIYFKYFFLFLVWDEVDETYFSDLSILCYLKLMIFGGGGCLREMLLNPFITSDWRSPTSPHKVVSYNCTLYMMMRRWTGRWWIRWWYLYWCMSRVIVINI